jgi:Ca-activated chloride channel family protein
MSNFTFEYPWIFLLLIIFLICAKWCKQKSQSIYFPHIDKLFVNRIKGDLLLISLKWLGIVMAVSALASPVFKEELTSSKKEGRDIVLVLDSSESMFQGGFDPSDPYRNKFDVTKDIVADFINKRQSDRLGLITFADVAFRASPLTFEKKFLNGILKMQRIGIAGRRTAINDALIQGYALLNDSKAKSKVIILLTDGIDNMSKVSPEEVKEIIKLGKIKLYTIGIGNRGDFNAKYLQELAKVGKGKFYSATNSETLKRIYEAIDKLEVTKIDDKKVVLYEYLYIYPLFIAILSLLFLIYLRNQRGL